ncbi:MAG: hypothetical protein NTV94_04435, partial [Planctomycetota bacterium]|nr:hypothetical protein [Planctomycetota bacterium]
MRIFWIVLAILALVGVALSVSVFNPRPTLTLNAPPKPVAKVEPETVPPMAAPAAQPAAVPAAAPQAPAKEQPAATAAPTPATTPAADKPVTAAPAPAPAPAAAPQTHTPAPTSTPVPASPLSEAKPAVAPASGPASATAPAAAASASTVATTGAKVGGYDIAAGKVEKREDGSMLLDGKFVVKGEGTKEKPYEITWELLTSVDQDFDPHAGKKLLPERIAMLHDKYVKLGGYVAFPMNMQQPKELLLMLNQWDGCCIGVPPTPYDAIEVALDKTVTGEDRFATTGGVVGKMG